MLGGTESAWASLSGHGLFGSREEIRQGQLQAFGQEHGIVFCSTDWIGMACTDLPPGVDIPPGVPSPGDLKELADRAATGTLRVPDCDIVGG